MSYNHTLKYRTFDSLLADVANDFKKYQLKDLIDPSDTIKVARRVNYDLGLRINQTKEVVIEIEKGKAKLPNDFYVLNFALACGKYEAKVYYPQGTRTEEKIIGTVAPEYQVAPPEIIDLCETPIESSCDPCDPCSQCGAETNCEPCNTCCSNPSSCTLNCKGEVTQLVQVLTSETRTYSTLHPIKMISNPREIDCDCPNLYWDSTITGYIKDGWFYTSFETGTVYINYQGGLEDNEGNLLVVDHEVINEYYEYALKQRIIENLIMNDEEVNPNKIQLIEQRYRAARNNALSIVNMPNFAELKQLYQANRNAQYSKYYDMFSSYPRVYNRR
jgi:hypothetical protein